MRFQNTKANSIIICGIIMFDEETNAKTRKTNIKSRRRLIHCYDCTLVLSKII